MDPYATLNVPPESSREEIRAAFARIARSTHPDKAGDTASTQVFSQVDEAYKILNDDQMRAAFDEFGEEGREALTVLRSQRRGEAVRNISRHELRRMIKTIREMDEDSTSMGETLVRCHSTLKDWRDLINGTKDPSLPLFDKIFIVHNSRFESSDNQHSLTLGASAGSSRVRRSKENSKSLPYKPSLGGLNLTIQTIHALNAFEFGFQTFSLAGPTKKFHATCARPVTPWMNVNVGIIQDDDVTLHVGVNRRVGTLIGETVFNFKNGAGFLVTNFIKRFPVSVDGANGDARHSGSGAGDRPEEEAGKLSRELSLGITLPESQSSMDHLHLGVSWNEPLSRKRLIKSRVDVDMFNPVSFEVEDVRVINEFSKFSTRLQVSLASGLTLRFKFTRGKTKFDFPIHISNKISILNTLTCGFVPAILDATVRLVLSPWTRRLRRNRLEELRKVALMCRDRARNQILLLQAPALANREYQQKSDGLVILEARYGRRLDEKYSWNDRELRPNIDVTHPLQFFVTKSDPPSLDLSEGTKTRLLGFYDPSVCSVSSNQVWQAEEDELFEIDEEDEMQLRNLKRNRLYVRYLYRGLEYEKVWLDEESVHIPHPDAVRVQL